MFLVHYGVLLEYYMWLFIIYKMHYLFSNKEAYHQCSFVEIAKISRFKKNLQIMQQIIHVIACGYTVSFSYFEGHTMFLE